MFGRDAEQGDRCEGRNSIPVRGDSNGVISAILPQPPGIKMTGLIATVL